MKKIVLIMIVVLLIFIKIGLKKDNIKEEYYVFSDGDEVFYNPITNTKCLFGQEGCMKWYSFLDDKSSSHVNLILSRNLIDNAMYADTKSNKNGPITANKLLAEKTKYWSVKARMITALEISKITKYNNWNEEEYYFNNNSSKVYISNGEVNKYYWLFDNTNGCVKHGCKVEYSHTDGYWTSSKYQYDEEKAWIVYGAGSLTTMYDVSSLIFGIRPVVSVLKDVLK